MKNVIINNGKGTVTVSSAHNVTVTETAITIDLVTGFNLIKTRKATTKAKTKKKVSAINLTKTTKKKAGRPKKTTVK
tara:strand:- start:797 stop:1027 length:231 start_codon:yes stop_codon:yes gene_type:complete